ncbi:uncharacterized protein LOC126975627 isoform X2 [Leptidea sinapis]|uniref:uncharacterized protein LOC126975627 isoform X2 n=1 Tax=Leptidea sinapis TaxID=189913 RepID=UPI00213A5740|nr:uncharacterized protein LOC126975627 isoform X2 [Leptidea sinapis]
MLHCLKNGSCFREHLIPRQTAMSEVATGSPVDEECLLDMDACYETFDKDGDGKLNLEEFRLICKALFRNDKGYIYPLDEDKARHIFQVFDKNGDGFVDKEEFVFCWNHWIKVIVRPVSAFLIVDVQNDFISGTLNISKCNAQQDGSEVVEPINRLLESVPFDCVFYSLDWHPPDHVSFIDNVHMRELHPSSPIFISTGVYQCMRPRRLVQQLVCHLGS